MRNTKLAVFGVMVFAGLVGLAVWSGCDGGSAGTTTGGKGPVTPPNNQELPPQALVQRLFSTNQQQRDTAKVRLLSMRERALPYLMKGANDNTLSKSGEIIQIMLELGYKRIRVEPIFHDWLKNHFTPEKLNDILGTEVKTGDDLERAQAYEKAFAQIVTALIELGEREKIPVDLRVFYFSRVLSDLAMKKSRAAHSLTARESAMELLRIGPPAISTVAEYLNSANSMVARKFMGVALWMHRQRMAAAIVDLLKRKHAENMQIYATLSHLTLRKLSITDVGFPRPPAPAFNANPMMFLRQWHPKMLANWEIWWTTHKDKTVDQWWSRGFQSAGYFIPNIRSRTAVPKLIEALTSEDQYIRVGALVLLRRLTYRGLSREVTYLEVWEHDDRTMMDRMFPNPKDRPKRVTLTEAKLNEIRREHWESWWKVHKDKDWHELAQLEAAVALNLLGSLRGTKAELRLVEAELGFTAEQFLRRLCYPEDPSQLDEIPWGSSVDQQRLRARFLVHLQERLLTRLKDPALQASHKGWWFD